MSRNKHYFVADVHLGLQAFDPVKRERVFTDFLNTLPQETSSLYLLGDIFDFWYEYKYVIPKGFARTFGALASLADRGVEIFFIKGNHDLWTFGYLERELGIKILEEASVIDINHTCFFIAHGDELVEDPSHRFMKRVFKNRFMQFCFAAVHPRWGISFALNWSRHNRLARGKTYPFRGESDPLYKFASGIEEKVNAHHFIFGHMHTPGSAITPKGAGFHILGEWIHGCEYLVFDSDTKELTWKSGRNSL